MTAVTRIYLYVVTFAALASVGLGIANLVRAVLETWVSTASSASTGYLQDQVSQWGAAAVVGLPIWYAHWWWARRLTADGAERSSPLRRLFLYAVLSGSTIVIWTAANEVLSGAATAIVSAPVTLIRIAIPPLPLIAVGIGVWLYHWRIAATDRDLVGESGASATLRRWYIFGFALVGFVALLIGCQTMLMATWLRLTTGATGPALSVAGASDATIGLFIWFVHWAWLPRLLDANTRQQDQRATLRSVYLFIALAVVLIGTLSGVSQALYYLLGRMLGIAAPGGVGGSLIQAAAGPISVAVVYGAGWMYQRAAIAQSAHEVEVPRQVGVRRIYQHLTALVALAVLAVGLTGLLWTFGDLVTRPSTTLGADWWRDRVSLFATLTIVGLPVWLLHWRPQQTRGEQSLARRIYLYTSLIGAMLAVLGSAAATVYRVLSLVLGSADSSTVTIDLSHSLAIAVVAAGIALYQWRMVQMDARVSTKAAGAAAPARVVVELAAPTSTVIDAALEYLRGQGVTVRHHA
jgi:Domain of unknown function (DUF5671)